MKIEEAYNKMCPFAMMAYFMPGNNSRGECAASSCCETSNCMAWRWFDTATKNEGYCGLAGKEGAE